MKLLVVEDSAKLRKSLGVGLRRLGYTVDLAADGEEGLAFARHGDYEVVVLDLMLPKISGLDVLRQLRARKQGPEVLILSARDRVDDRVQGLRLGADDYLVKPFAFDELDARLKALVRRRYRQKPPIIDLGAIQVDTALHQARCNRFVFDLTPTEMSILEYLALNRGRVVSAESLHEQVYDANTYSSKNAIEAHISCLRKKLRKQSVDQLIKTRRGFGYFIA